MRLKQASFGQGEPLFFRFTVDFPKSWHRIECFIRECLFPKNLRENTTACGSRFHSMKTFVALILALVSLTSPGRAESASETSFLNAIRTAIQEKSLEKLSGLTYYVGASEPDKTMTAGPQKLIISSGEIENISFVPLPKDFDPIASGRGENSSPIILRSDW
jgi:hypothetical protein